MTPIDNYCERYGPEFWAEPLNAISNGAFVVAAIMAAICAYQNGVHKTASVLILLVLVLMIAVGSFLFHTLAVVWSGIADVVPIMLFQLCFLGVYARSIANLPRGRVVMLLLGFVVLSQTIPAFFPPEFLNGSLMYAGALLFLGGFAVYHKAAQKAEPDLMILATLVFALSLMLRTMDPVVCDYIPEGTHYFWHILNAGVLYLVTRAYIVNLKIKG